MFPWESKAHLIKFYDTWRLKLMSTISRKYVNCSILHLSASFSLWWCIVHSPLSMYSIRHCVIILEKRSLLFSLQNDFNNRTEWYFILFYNDHIRTLSLKNCSTNQITMYSKFLIIHCYVFKELSNPPQRHSPKQIGSYSHAERWHWIHLDFPNCIIFLFRSD